MINSSFWIAVIGIGAVILAVANIQYNRTREAENKRSLSGQALALLQPELQRNQEYLAKRITSEMIELTIESPFEIAAWETVSNSDLLLGLSSETLSNLMQAYYLMNRANILHSKFIESSIGVPSALQQADKTRKLISGHLSKVLDELKPIMNSILEL